MTSVNPSASQQTYSRNGTVNSLMYIIVVLLIGSCLQDALPHTSFMMLMAFTWNSGLLILHKQTWSPSTNEHTFYVHLMWCRVRYGSYRIIKSTYLNSDKSKKNTIQIYDPGTPSFKAQIFIFQLNSYLFKKLKYITFYFLNYQIMLSYAELIFIITEWC